MTYQLELALLAALVGILWAMVGRLKKFCFSLSRQAQLDLKVLTDLNERVQKLEELRADEMHLNARLRDVPVFSRKLGTIHQLFKD